MRIRLSLSIFGNSVWRVMELSINPAIMNMGIVPTTIFTPLLAPLLNDSSLEYVPGKSHPLPKASPAAPATIIDQISSVPCSHMASMDSQSKSCWKKNIWNAPIITPLLKSIYPVPKLVRIPMAKQ